MDSLIWTFVAFLVGLMLLAKKDYLLFATVTLLFVTVFAAACDGMNRDVGEGARVTLLLVAMFTGYVMFGLGLALPVYAIHKSLERT